jgi:hypothetical protein
MDASALHLRLDEIAPALLAGVAPDEGGGGELGAALAHAAAGCSRCARALVNARETGVDLALAATPSAGSPASGPAGGHPQTPGRALRARLLGSVSARAARPASPPRRFHDPSAEVARLHIGAPGDAERVAEVDELSAGLPREDDACARFLAQMERITGFPLLFVSVVRGERVGYRVQRGLDVGIAEMRDRRRETTFCTHTVAGDAPLVVQNAAEEPFFRGSTMVQRARVKAYVGVPLTTSRGIVIGTVCAMDWKPRAVGAELVRALSLFTEPILAEVEQARCPPGARIERTAGGAPLHRAPWFSALCDVELCVARAAGRPSALVVARGRAAAALGDVGREDEAAGWASPGREAVALLLPGVDPRGAEARCAELRAGLEARGLGGDAAALRWAPAGAEGSAAGWLAAAGAAGAAGDAD